MNVWEKCYEMLSSSWTSVNAVKCVCTEWNVSCLDGAESADGDERGGGLRDRDGDERNRCCSVTNSSLKLRTASNASSLSACNCRTRACSARNRLFAASRFSRCLIDCCRDSITCASNVFTRFTCFEKLNYLWTLRLKTKHLHLKFQTSNKKKP